MSGETYILSVDVGTTTIRSVLYDPQCQEIASYQERVTTILSTGAENEVLIEIDPEPLFQQFVRVVKQVYEKAPEHVTVKIALCTQRNSIVLWNKLTNVEETRIICWNDKRANKTCQEMNGSWLLKGLNIGGSIVYTITRKNRFLAAHTLKFLGAMVSHRLIVTIDQSEKLKKLHKDGELMFGCLETWLLMKASEQNGSFVEASNISPSGMYDPWINEYNYLILRLIKFPIDLLLPIADSNLGDVDKLPVLAPKHLDKELTITSILADQQAAMFGCGIWEEGDVKITLGTGTFVNVHTGKKPYASMSGLYPVVAWRINKETEYAAEGNAHDTAVILSWAQSIGLFDDVQQTSDIAQSVANSNGTVFVPAFRGIQTPINDEAACCGFLALRPDTNKAHMVRAILESIAFRVYQIYTAAQSEVYINTASPIRICGGVANNDFVCQSIANLLNRKVERLTDSDHVAAKGVAMLAGYSNGVWTKESLKSLITVSKVFLPEQEPRDELLKTFQTWSKAVTHCLGFFT